MFACRVERSAFINTLELATILDVDYINFSALSWGKLQAWKCQWHDLIFKLSLLALFRLNLVVFIVL